MISGKINYLLTIKKMKNALLTKKASHPNPMSPPDGVLKYEKKRYAHFDQKIVNSLEHKILKKFLAKTNIIDGQILNVPCGFGRFTNLFNSLNLKISFFDLHPKMVVRCLEKFNNKKHSFITGSIRALPFKNNSFDAVINIRFFHHYFENEDRLLMLRELQRVSKKYVILTYYRDSIIHKFIKKLNDKGHRIVMFKKKEFYQELLSAGLKPVTEKAPLPFLHAQRFLFLEKI